MRRSLRKQLYIQNRRRTILETEDNSCYSEGLGFLKEGTMATTTKPLTDNPIVQRILGLIREKGKKEKDLTDYLGISSGSISKWKYDGSVEYLKHIEEICEYFDTTPNYLFFGSDDEDRLLIGEKNMIQMYRSLDDGRKKCVLDMIKYLSDAEKA